KLVN
ncbi:hypothetical protein D018_0108B, partial [Vibrio parahaemolyticus VP2007-007]